LEQRCCFGGINEAVIVKDCSQARFRDSAFDLICLYRFLSGLHSHIDLLSKKDYAGKRSALGQVVGGVVLFIPLEGALSMALEWDQ
tara:strand:- start:594 stop:851 length:258 start_codon:yes stop_codon:yes gene_type:complete